MTILICRIKARKQYLLKFSKQITIMFFKYDVSFQQQHQQQQQLKQLESVIPHIQEQINLNIMQQSQILHQLNGLNNGLGSTDKKTSRQQLQLQLQQLALQQHQLMQQLQLSNRQYMINLQPFMMPQGKNYLCIFDRVKNEHFSMRVVLILKEDYLGFKVTIL